jgi:hypothetical protein
VQRSGLRRECCDICSYEYYANAGGDESDDSAVRRRSVPPLLLCVDA